MHKMERHNMNIQNAQIEDTVHTLSTKGIFWKDKNIDCSIIKYHYCFHLIYHWIFCQSIHFFIIAMFSFPKKLSKLSDHCDNCLFL